METVRCAVIGLGNRGRGILKHVLLRLDGVKVTAVCDLYADRAEAGRDAVSAATGETPFCSTDAHDVIPRSDVDAVIVTAGWEAHIPLAIESMKAGKPCGVEVGGAYCLADCFELVRVCEETGVPVMLMENCCYNADELAVTAMVRDGIFGRVVHCSGAYGHDLRHEIGFGNIERHYRLRNYLGRNCENYPTHELGPIAKILNIGRGNRMVSLTSMSCGSFGMAEYCDAREELADLRGKRFAQGDIFHTVIGCENGESILLRLDTTLPRFYSRELTVRGTRGLYDMNNDLVFIDGRSEKEYWSPRQSTAELAGNMHRDYFDRYLPRLWKDITPEEKKAGHGGMDYLIYRDFFSAVRTGSEMPIDVYDMAAWMSITCLSERSAREGRAVAIPDFTRGLYRTREPKDVTELDY